MSLTQSWKWYGLHDPVSLKEVSAFGASGVVTALGQLPEGVVWPLEMIKESKAGLAWEVVESVPVHEAIKTHNNHFDLYLENYKKTLRNLAACGVRTICYRFTPLLDGVRTELEKRWGSGAKALYFDWVDLAVVDLKVSLR